MWARAEFESSYSSKESLNQVQGFYEGDYVGASYGGILNDVVYVVWDVIDIVWYLMLAIIIVFWFFFLFYLLISLFKNGGAKTLAEMKSCGVWFANIVKKLFVALQVFLKRIFHFFWNRKFLSIMIIGAFILIEFLWAVVNGYSRILRFTEIDPGFVWVDLKNSRVLEPWYHLYSPIRSSFFLSPTNNFSFNIVDVPANSEEELPVVLDYRVTFSITDEKRLDLYKNNGAKSIQVISSDIVMPRMLEVINGIIKDYSFKDIGWKHNEIKGITITWANEVLWNIGIQIQDLNILSIRPPESYIKSKEALLNAENELRLSQSQLEAQQKESEKKVLEAESNKKVKIIEAEALLEYNSIVSQQALTPTMIEMKQLEIEEKKVEKWDGKLPWAMSLDEVTQ